MTITDLQKALDETSASAEFYIKADAYHDGTVAEKFASAKMANLLRGSANRFRMNYARVPVTALCDRVKIASISVPDDAEATAYLAEQWRANGMGNLYREVQTKSASTGSAYIMAWPDPESEDGVDISVIDPTTTRAHYSVENPNKMLFVSRVWTEGKRTRVNLYYRDRIEKYISKSRATGKIANGFEPYVDLTDENGDAVWPLPNPYNTIPIFHFHLGSGYGRPVNRDAWEPQDAINKLTAVMMSTTDFQGFPQRYALENPSLTPEDADMDDWDVPTNPGEVKDPEDSKESLKAGPAGLWWLKANSVGEFSAAESKNFLEPTQQYIKAISTTTKTPLHAFHGMGDAPSGESLRAANAPLNDAALSAAGWWEPTWIEFLTFLCLLGEFEDAKPAIVWANPERADDADFWDSQKTKIEAGVPLQQILIEAGYTETQITEWYPDVEVPRTIEQVTALSEALTKIKEASAAGVPVDVTKIVPKDLQPVEAPDPDTLFDLAVASTTPSGVNR